jgi:C4-dicarboxylate transporter DctM subunit
MINLAAITPPYGINLFVLAGVTKLPIETIYRGILPFVLTALIGIGIMVAFPQIATWLPDLLGYKPVVLGY